jgi:hypothetical protein
MHCKNPLPLAFSILLICSVTQGSPFGSWSASGVVVNKTFRSMPLTRSPGVDGIYKLELRDKNNKIRRQMVTRAVFLAYEIGDPFNELVALPQTRIAGAKKNALGEAGSDDSSRASAETKTEIKNQVASVHFTQDMLPETEGF